MMVGSDSAMRYVRSCVLLALAMVVLATTGCGGSGDARPSATAQSQGTTTRSGPAPSKAPASAHQLIAAADAICKQLNTKLAAGSTAHPDNSALARSSLQHAALERTAVAELGKLTPPASLARDWKQIISLRRTLAQELLQVAQYVAANDAKRIRALAASKQQAHKRLFEVAQRNGFKDCAQVGSGGGGAPAPPQPTFPRKDGFPV